MHATFVEVWELEWFQTAKVTFKITGNGATYNFQLVFHCKCVSVLHRFQDIITYLPKCNTSLEMFMTIINGHLSLNILLPGYSIIPAPALLASNQHMKFKVPSFADPEDMITTPKLKRGLLKTGCMCGWWNIAHLTYLTCIWRPRSGDPIHHQWERLI